MSCMSLYNIQASRDCWPGSFKTRPLLWTTFEGKRRNLKVNVDAAQFPAFSRKSDYLLICDVTVSLIFLHFPAFSCRTGHAPHRLRVAPADSRRFPHFPVNPKHKDFRWFRILQNVDEMG